MARAREHPIPAPGADRPAGPGEVLLGIITPLYRQSSWPLLTNAIQGALDGDGTAMVRLADDYLGRMRNGEYGNANEVNAAVNCLDDAWPRDLAHYESLAARLQQTAPHFGPSLAVEGVVCAVWPVDPQPLATPHYDGATPLLVIGTTHDPATPFKWALGVRADLASSVLLTHDGDGHTAFGGSACVDTVVNAYLLTLAVPQDGAICGTAATPAAPPTPPAAAAAGPSGGTPAATPPPATSAPSPVAATPGAPAPAPAPPAGAAAEPSPVLAGVLIALGAAVLALAVIGWYAIRERTRGE
jgi:hypothetical protein